MSIRGNGTVINLGGDSLVAIGTAKFDIDACFILQSKAGLVLRRDVSSLITQCTFYGNQIGILGDGRTGMIEVTNSIFANNSQYGLACCEETARILQYIDMYQNALGDYVEWCPVLRRRIISGICTAAWYTLFDSKPGFC